MKKCLIIVFTAIVVCATICFVGCGGSKKSDLAEITGVTFSDKTTVYDGEEKEIVISGDLPQGVTVEYSSNKGTDAGTYNATATLKGEGYKDKVLKASLIINKAEISGITFSGSNTVYDGNEKVLTINGELPDGVTVEYASNKGTDAGTYNATATLKGKNYNEKILNATLFIDKAEITGITVEENQSVMFDDEKHLPVYRGTLPKGVTVTFKYNDEETQGLRGVGSYAFKIEFGGKNYKTLIFDCLYKIKMDYTGLAEQVIDAFGNVPEPWSFLPDSFDVTAHTLSANVSYDDFVGVSSIPLNGIGKQMDVVYGLLNKSTTALSYVNRVYAIFNTIKEAYTTFFDNNPDDYSVFTKTIGGFNITIILNGNKYELNTSIGSVAIKIFADTENKSYGARIQLTATTVLKYTCSENKLLIAMNILDVSGTQVEFVRSDDGKVTGYLYETLVAKDKQLTETCALIKIDSDYTTVIGTKGDFIPLSDSRNVEVYSSSTGRLLGTEVREQITVSGFTDMYDTLWYMLKDIGGITNIKKVDEMSGTNPDTIWINGRTEKLHTTLVGGFSKKSASRRYDIEFKEMCFYRYNDENQEYEKVVCEIPMMFIQEQQADAFEANFKDKNEVTVSLNVSASTKKAVNYGYYDLLATFDAIKGLVDINTIGDYCKN